MVVKEEKKEVKSCRVKVRRKLLLKKRGLRDEFPLFYDGVGHEKYRNLFSLNF